MKAHLTNEELTNRLLGQDSMTIDAHLMDCADCQKELSHLKDSISLFRDTAVAWSETAKVTRTEQLAPRHPWRLANWALVAAVLLLVILPAWFIHHRGEQSRQAASVSPKTLQTQIDQDNQLLSAVSSEITEGVPGPMQPLQLANSYDDSGSPSRAK